MKKDTKQNAKHILFFLFIFIVLGTQLQAQKFADKDFYLFDSIILADLAEDDQILLDSVLTKYKVSDNDTLKLEYLQELSYGLLNDELWPKYNDLILSEVLAIRKKTKDEAILKVCHLYEGMHYNTLGVILSNTNEIDLVLKNFYKAYDCYLKGEDKALIGAILGEIGIIYYNSGDFKLALKKFEDSNKILEQLNNSDDYSTLSKSFKNLGNIYLDFKDNELAEKNYQKALYYAKKTEEVLRTGYVYHSLSIFAFKIKNYKNANIYLDSAVYIFEKENHLRGLSIMTTSYGVIAKEQKDFEAAEEFYLKGIEIGKNKRTADALEFAYINYCEFLLEQDKLKQAEDYIGKAKEQSIKNGKVVAHQSKITNLLKSLYLKKKEFKNAYETQEIYYALKDSIYNDGLRTALIKYDINNEYEKQKEIDDIKHEKEIAISEEKKQKNRIGFIASGIIAGLIALFSFLIFNRLQLIKKQKKDLDNAYEQLEESKKNELAVSNLKALQSQMNPHFIFNALNSVQDLVLLKDIRNSNKYLGKFSDLIRKILLSSKEQFISLEEEVEILNLYLDLEKLRFGDDFVVDLQCNVSEQQQDEIMLPAMFIQPYIENAIKHGLFHKQGTKELLVHFNIKGNALECIIKDNGIGQKKAEEFKQKRLHLHTGFSTEAINERIRLLNETSDKKIELQIEDLFEDEKAIGTKITLLFPV